MIAQRTVRATAWSLGGHIVPLLVTLMTIPVFLNLIGQERFGALALVWTITNYFAFFGFGLGPACAQLMASRRSDLGYVRSIFVHTFVLSLGLAVLAALAMILLGSTLAEFLLFNSSVVGVEFQDSLLFLALLPLTAILSAPFVATLTAHERFQSLAIFNSVAGGLRAVVPLCVAFAGAGSLPALILSLVAVQIGTATAQALSALSLIGLQRSFTLDRGIVQRLLGYGSWVTVTSVVGPLLATLDRVIIGGFVGVAQVAYYSIAQTLNEKISVVPGSLATVLFPKFAAMNDRSEARAFGLRAIENINVIMTVVCVGAIILVGPFFTLWMSSAFAAEVTAVAIVLLWGAWLNSLARIPASFLNGTGRPEIMAIAHVAELLPYAALLYVLLQQFGILGAALAWSLRVAADTAILARFAGMLSRIILGLRLPIVFLSVASWIALVPPAFGAAWFSAVVALLSTFTMWVILWMPNELANLAQRLPVIRQLPWGRLRAKTP